MKKLFTQFYYEKFDLKIENINNLVKTKKQPIFLFLFVESEYYFMLECECVCIHSFESLRDVLELILS